MLKLGVPRQEAMASQLSTAAHAIMASDIITAITSAGATEQGTPNSPHGAESLFDVMKRIAVEYGIRADDAGTSANRVRNWLKHVKEPDPLHIQLEHDFFMVCRAITKFQNAYGEDALPLSAGEFANWARAHPRLRRLISRSET